MQNDKWKFDFWHVKCLLYQEEPILIPFLKIWKIFTPKFLMKYSKKIVQILQHLKYLKCDIWNMLNTMQKKPTSLHGLDQETLFWLTP